MLAFKIEVPFKDDPSPVPVFHSSWTGIDYWPNLPNSTVIHYPKHVLFPQHAHKGCCILKPVEMNKTFKNTVPTECPVRAQLKASVHQLGKRCGECNPAHSPWLSAAFDTINHGILLEWLRKVGVENTVLQQFCSYLQGHFQKVVMWSHCLTPWVLSSGAPECSILTPMLFNLSMKPLGGVISEVSLIRSALYLFYLNQERWLGQVSVSLHRDDFAMTLHAWVTSRLDYYNVT